MGAGALLDEVIWRADALGAIPGAGLLLQAEPSPFDRLLLYKGLAPEHRTPLMGGAPHRLGFEDVAAGVPFALHADARVDPRSYASVAGDAPGQGVLLQPAWPFDGVSNARVELPEARRRDSFSGDLEPGPAGSSYITRRDATRDLLWLTVLHAAAAIGSVAVFVLIDDTSRHLVPELMDRVGFEPVVEVARRHGLAPVDVQRVVARWRVEVTEGRTELEVELLGGQPDRDAAIRAVARSIIEGQAVGEVRTADGRDALRRRAAPMAVSGSLSGQVVVGGNLGVSFDPGGGSWEDLLVVAAAGLIDHL